MPGLIPELEAVVAAADKLEGADGRTPFGYHAFDAALDALKTKLDPRRSPPFNCPLCHKVLDLQGQSDTGNWDKYELWCHACVAQLTISVRKQNKKDQS